MCCHLWMTMMKNLSRYREHDYITGKKPSFSEYKRFNQMCIYILLEFYSEYD